MDWYHMGIQAGLSSASSSMVISCQQGLVTKHNIDHKKGARRPTAEPKITKVCSNKNKSQARMSSHIHWLKMIAKLGPLTTFGLSNKAVKRAKTNNYWQKLSTYRNMKGCDISRLKYVVSLKIDWLSKTN